jgi:hypothetical protein
MNRDITIEDFSPKYFTSIRQDDGEEIFGGIFVKYHDQLEGWLWWYKNSIEGKQLDSRNVAIIRRSNVNSNILAKDYGVKADVIFRIKQWESTRKKY